MQIELNKDELAVVLDGLASLPLARSYNVFNKLLPLMNGPGQQNIGAVQQQQQDAAIQQAKNGITGGGLPGIRMPPLPEPLPDTPPESGGPQATQ